MKYKQLNNNFDKSNGRLTVARYLHIVAKPLILIGNFIGRLSSWLVLAIMGSVLLTVLMNASGINSLVDFDREFVLFGNAITINSITELQWHFFGLFILAGGNYALHSNIHVRVDLLHSNMSDTKKNLIEIIGHIIFLIPFCLLIAWLSRHMVEMSFISGEKSSYGGLTDRYLIKAALPAGFILLAVGALGEVIERLARIIESARVVEETSDAR